MIESVKIRAENPNQWKLEESEFLQKEKKLFHPKFTKINILTSFGHIGIAWIPCYFMLFFTWDLSYNFKGVLKNRT